VDLALIAAAGLAGAAGLPHCAAMCGPACAAVLGSCGSRDGRASRPTFVWHGARLAGYATAGAIAAGGVGALTAAVAVAPWLRPVWVALQAVMLCVGVVMLVTGRLPQWWTGARWMTASAGLAWVDGGSGRGTTASRPLTRATLAGLAWVAWPCGLLQSAIAMAALTSTASSGAAAMAVFALASAPGLAVGPWLARRLGPDGLPGVWRVRATRLSGAVVAVAAGWALTHGVWQRIAELCLS
jgi:uncharacterized protein